MRTLSGKISLQTIKDLLPGDELRDVELKGFGVRRQQSQTSYFVHTRIRGRLRRLTIGRHGSPWTPDTARKEASRLLLTIRTGGDPAKERDDRRKIPLFDDVASRFLELHGPKLKPRTRDEYTRIIKLQLLKTFGGKFIDDIDTAQISRAHVSWKETPRAANHALSVLSKMLSWSMSQGYIKTGPNPCLGVQRYRENKRERYLSEDELAKLGAALRDAEAEGENPVVVELIRLLLLTGARLSELLTLEWSFVDVPRGIIRLPDSKTGAKTLLLSGEAVKLLERLPRLANNPFVFPGHVTGRHLVNIQKPWRTIRHRAGLDDVRLHDLRHSFASFSIDAGGTLPVIGRLLGHTQAQTTARYAHVAPSPARQIAEAVGARIANKLSSQS